MHLPFRRQSTQGAAGNTASKDEEEEGKAKTNFTSAFGDMSRFSKKMFTSNNGANNDDGEGTPGSATKESSSGGFFTKRSKSMDETGSRIAVVINLLEDFRLQCPQTHAGLVVAFAATTLSPLTDADVKFKWYRMDTSKDQFLQIDEGRRAWYPPTADDIGKKICAQCEDTFEQGYCRYAEAGPVEADPLLRSMVDSALQNGSYEVKDVSVSMGLNLVDPEVNSMMLSFDMQSKQRLSALEQSPVPLGAGGFAQLEKRFSVEVDSNGVFISMIEPVSAAVGTLTSSGRKGLLIKSSSSLQAQCTLPASIVLTIPLLTIADAPTAVSDGEQLTKGENAVVASPSKPSVVKTAVQPLPWEWIGDRSGPIFQQVETFFKNITSVSIDEIDAFKCVPDFKVCFACSDRMQRDTLALSIRTMASFDTKVGMRERMESLPWYGSSASSGVVQSTAGSDLGVRLKELELENKSLKRQRDELTLQLLESSTDTQNNSKSRVAVAGGGLEVLNGDDLSEDISNHSHGNDNINSSLRSDSAAENETANIQNYRAKIRSLENDIEVSRRKEMTAEQTCLEQGAHIKRLLEDQEGHGKNVRELTEKLAEVQQEAKQGKLEVENLRQQLLESQISIENAKKTESGASEVQATLREMENEIVSVRKALQDSDAAYQKQTSETRIIAVELKEAQVRAKELTDRNLVTEERISKLEEELRLSQETILSLTAERDSLIGEKKLLEEHASSAELYDDTLDKLDKLEGEKNHWQHKAESLAKDAKRMLKQIEDIQSASSYQLRESSKALEKRNEEYKLLEASIQGNKKNGTTDNSGDSSGSRRMSSFFRRDASKTDSDQNS